MFYKVLKLNRASFKQFNSENESYDNFYIHKKSRILKNRIFYCKQQRKLNKSIESILR